MRSRLTRTSPFEWRTIPIPKRQTKRPWRHRNERSLIHTRSSLLFVPLFFFFLLFFIFCSLFLPSFSFFPSTPSPTPTPPNRTDTICGLINGNDANAAGFRDYTPRRVHVCTYTYTDMRTLAYSRGHREWPFYKQLYMQLRARGSH